MLNKIKQTKRRAIQHTMQVFGKAEVTTRDEEFQMAVDNFKAMEHDLNAILKTLKAYQDITSRYTAENAALGCLLAAYFRAEQGPDSFRDPADKFMEGMTRSHNVVQRSCKVMMQTRVIDQITQLLDETFFTLKKEISQHDGLKTDLDSYRRRVKSLQEKGKLGNDPELIKFTTKLQRTQGAYDRLHNQLLVNLHELYMNRHEMLHPHFTTIMACQGELQHQLSNDMDQVLNNISSTAVDPIREDIRQVVNQGGPPMTAEEEADQNRSGSVIKGITSRIKRTSVRRGSAKSLEDPLGNGTPSKAPQGDEGAMFYQEGSMDSAAPSSHGIPGLGQSESMDSGAQSYTSSGYGEAQSPRHDQHTNATLDGSPSTTESSAASSSFAESETSRDNPFASPVAVPVAESYDPPREETRDVDMPSTPANEEIAIASFDYPGLDEQDISFVKGERIVVLKKIDEGWWSGRKEDGSVGLFPSNYVKLEAQ